MAGIIGVISTNGSEIGPFLAVEQAALTDLVLSRAGAPSDPKEQKTEVAVLFGWYNTVGYLAQAVGAVVSGAAVTALQSSASLDALTASRCVFFA